MLDAGALSDSRGQTNAGGWSNVYAERADRKQQAQYVFSKNALRSSCSFLIE
jgi:hypothetical protein